MNLVRFLLVAGPLVFSTAFAADYPLQSPNGRIAVAVHVAAKTTFDVAFNERPLLKGSAVGLTIGDRTFGTDAKVKNAATRSQHGVIAPPVHQKAAQFPENYNELRLELDGGAALVFRAYDEGVGYRWETALGADTTVGSEQVAYNFAGDYTTFYPEEQSFYSHNERLFLPRPMSEIGPKHLASIPVVVDAEFAKIALCDSDVEEYPGLWFHGTSGPGLVGTFPAYPTKLEPKGDRDVMVAETAAYLAKTKGTRTFPWRVIGIVAKDAELVTNPLVYLLAAPSRVADTSWIKPGKVAWDWWNDLNLTGVDFRSGVNNATYKAYIDFAAENGLSYIVLDEGWYKLGHALEQVPDINVPELVEYGRAKNVGVILWVTWKSLDEQLTAALDQYAKWGVRGVKVDFMQRDDQVMMEFYHRVARETASRHMLVDFHGAIRSAELTRTYPNLISNEGVRGNEWNKWSNHITPEHKASLPFTRMFVGPMDFTPGGTHNANREGFASNFSRPGIQGTRVSEMALYVVFESPLQMLCDTPSNYRHEPDMLAFLRTVPTTWDESKPLDGRIGDYVMVARRNGSDWYIGAITDWTARDLTLDLSFLPAGTYAIDEYRDGVNADRNAEDFKRTRLTVTNASKVQVHLAPGGGYVAQLKKQ